MTETTTIQLGQCIGTPNAWRANNLLKMKHCTEKETFFEVSFQWVEHTHHGVKQVNLIYQILK
jgi:hypothetical protein